MQKIASPQDLQAELRRMLAYCQGQHPSRQVLASQLRGLSHRLRVKTASDLPEREIEQTLGRLPGVSKAEVIDHSRPSSGVFDVTVSLEMKVKKQQSVQLRRNGPYAKRITEFEVELRRMKKAITDALKKIDGYDIKVSLPGRKSEPKDKDGGPPAKFYDHPDVQVDFFVRPS